MSHASTATSSKPLARPAPFWGATVLLALVMALALPTEPLFFGNQHTKLLPGLAAAGFGHLAEDWQVQTHDPIPVFRTLVTFVFQTSGMDAFYGLQALSFLAMALGLLVWYRLARQAGVGPAPCFWALVLVLAFLHTNQAGGKLFQGVATQYLIDRAFEPANFGVLILLGLAAIAAGRYVLGVLAVLIAALLHPAYAIPGGMLLTAALALVPADERRRGWPTIVTAGTALGAYILWLAFALPQGAGEAGPSAAEILTDRRIPDHSHIGRWFDVDAAFKLVMVGLAAALLRHHPIGRFLAAALIITIVSSLATLAPEAAKLRLVAPWRTSVVLVPIANIVVLTWALGHLMAVLDRRSVRLRQGLAVGLALATVAIGGFNLADKAERYAAPPAAHHVWLRKHARPGLVVLTPIGESDFRLATGVPQYVSFKTHPYRDQEVREWWRRVEVARRVQRAPEKNCARLQEEHKRTRVSHVLWPADQVAQAPCPFLEEAYRDRRVVLFALDLGQ